MTASRPELQVALIASLTLSLLCLASPVRAADFDGTFISGDGERIVLKQQGARVTGAVTVGGMSLALSGTVQGSALQAKVRMPTGEELPFSGRLGPKGLVVTVAGEAPEVYSRQGGAAGGGEARPPSPAGSRQSPEPTQQVSPAEKQGAAPAAKGPAASGTTYRAEYDGWGMHIPRGWKYVKRGDTLVVASDKEAGMILVEATSATDPAALVGELRSALAELGTFPEVPQPQELTFPAGRGIYAEVEGKAQDGTALRVRAVGVIGKEGTVTLVGITTLDKQKLAVLRQREDAIARSVFFFKPKVSPSRGLIAGEWYSYSGGSTLSGGGGSESVLSFCPDGRYFSSYESSYSGGAGTGGAWGNAGQSGGAGRWRVQGAGNKGQILVTRANGTTATISYSVQNRSIVYFSGRKHARMGRKRCR